MLIAGVTALSVVALFGCQQQTPAAPYTAPTSGSTSDNSGASVTIAPATEQTSTASLSVLPATSGSMQVTTSTSTNAQ